VADSFYKNLAVECSRAHISMDVFLFPHAHIDLATLGRSAPVTHRESKRRRRLI